MPDILPDSRLASNNGAVMVDWRMPDGTTVRCECVPTYCANCGKLGDFVPKENTTFAFYLCNQCAESHGEIAGVMMIPDEVFFEKVNNELLDRYGRIPNQQELHRLSQQGWGPLASLVKESPIQVRN